MTDLFRTKKEALLGYIKTKEFIKTSDIIRWGCNNMCNSSTRYAREFAEKGVIERLTKDEKIFRFGNIVEEVYKVK